jgi:hypothetical protein
LGEVHGVFDEVDEDLFDGLAVAGVGDDEGGLVV